MTPLTIVLVCVMLLMAAALGAFFAVLRRPPVVHVDLGDVRIDMVGTLDMTQAIPSTLTVRVQPVPAQSLDWGAQQAQIPLDILKYVDEESDEWARVARRQRARALFNENANWEHVLETLKREDGFVDEDKNESNTTTA